jgi:hypothetical protein
MFLFFGMEDRIYRPPTTHFFSQEYALLTFFHSYSELWLHRGATTLCRLEVWHVAYPQSNDGGRKGLPPADSILRDPAKATGVRQL